MRSIIIILSFSALMSACIKKKTSWVILGNVQQYDQYGVQKTTDLDQVIVSVKGKNISSKTDAAGNYTLLGLFSGTCDILFSRTGYGQWQQQNFHVMEGSKYNLNGYSLQIPDYTFSGSLNDSLAAINPTISYSYLKVTTQTNTLQAGAGLLVIRSADPGLSINDPFSYSYSNLIELNDSAISQQCKISRPINSGTWYYKFYPHPFAGDAAYYYHIGAKKNTYYAAGTQVAGTFSITVP